MNRETILNTAIISPDALTLSNGATVKKMPVFLLAAAQSVGNSILDMYQGEDAPHAPDFYSMAEAAFLLSVDTSEAIELVSFDEFDREGKKRLKARVLEFAATLTIEDINNAITFIFSDATATAAAQTKTIDTAEGTKSKNEPSPPPSPA